jgi:hypothetical protein
MEFRGFFEDCEVEWHPIPPDEVADFASVLIEDTRQRGPGKHNKDKFTNGKAKDKILLVYPFGANQDEINSAATNLRELKHTLVHDVYENGPDKTRSIVSLEKEENDRRTHYVTIRVEDYERLGKQQWLNDSLVDFFMLWISRDSTDFFASDAHFFTSHFFSTLSKKGAKNVESWTARRNIDIFRKKLIFIPVNKALHWSLCVVVNPGAIGGRVDPYKPMPCMLFFDSLNMHSASATKKEVMKWLNQEWMRIHKTEDKPFHNDTFYEYCPDGKLSYSAYLIFAFDHDKMNLTPLCLAVIFIVPLQDNGSDCGVFVCRYAYALYRLRHLDFTYYDAFQDKSVDSRFIVSPKYRRKAFKDLITKGVTFQFSVEDITRIRDEFKELIQNLSKIFEDWKRSEVVAAKRAGKKEENEDSKESETVTYNLDENKSDGFKKMSEEEEEVVLVGRESSDGPSLSPGRDDRTFREDSSDNNIKGGSDNPITLHDDDEAPQVKRFSSSSSSISSNDRFEKMSTDEIESPTTRVVETNREDRYLQQYQSTNNHNEINQYSAEDQSEDRPSQDEGYNDGIWKEIKSRISL